MQTFLNNVVKDILTKTHNLSNYNFILPSKRSGVFLKEQIKFLLSKPAILPKIISIEEFITELSTINLIDNTTLLFEFYHIYKEHTPLKETDSFDKFATWATTLIQDFNEIDRHLIDAEYIFSYLTDIKRIEELLQGENKTDLINNRLLFFEKFKTYYNYFREHLLEKRIGYQGLQYREAVENIYFYINNLNDVKITFVGFNALNKAEEHIVQELLNHEIATIYWDIDNYYFENNHNAASFIKRYHDKWTYFNTNEFKWLSENFSTQKNIQIIGAPKNISQIKYAGEILSFIKNSEENFKNTALVLADESLLTSTINSLPKDVENVNITMGFELKNIPIANLFENILRLHLNSKMNRFYYKDIISILQQNKIKNLDSSLKVFKKIISHISSYNYTYLSKNDLLKLTENNIEILNFISILFDDWKDNADTAIKNCITLISLIRESKNSDHIEKEYLFRFYNVFQQLSNLNEEFGYLNDIKTLHQFYKQVLRNEKLSFKGEPLTGLQIMGMLETRVLDFKNLIITSVNEGILPAGKSDNSFIPFSVKKEVGLPTYQEKDTIFSYHFFRLLQRAENVYLLYNTESDTYGSGERSRFITQLEVLKENEIEQFVVSPKINKSDNQLKQLSKSSLLFNELKHLAVKGFSPTALTTYILNPFEFYKQKILKIKEIDEVEETIAANTLGTIIHKTLEQLYLPYKDKYLTETSIEEIKTRSSTEVKKWFLNEFGNGNIASGKNFLIFNVANQFIDNFLQQELLLIKQGKQIKILLLEHDLETLIEFEGIDFPVCLKGQVDRIDEVDGVIRIIDYKTGKVAQNELIIKDWNLITSDYKKYSKSFQVLFYALLYSRTYNLELNITELESGVISFKNLKSGYLRVNNRRISSEDLDNFIIQLNKLLLDIFDPDNYIIEKEVSFIS